MQKALIINPVFEAKSHTAQPAEMFVMCLVTTQIVEDACSQGGANFTLVRI